MVSIYQHPIQVEADHLDEMKHVNNVVYLQWIQDAAKAHWLSTASDAMLEQYVWVVLRHEIDYKAPAKLNDALIAKTWVRAYDGVKSTRIVQIIREVDQQLMVEAKSLWCLLNAKNHRPSRVGEDIKSQFIAEI